MSVCVHCLVQCLLIFEILISNTKFIISHTKMLIKTALKISCEKILRTVEQTYIE